MDHTKSEGFKKATVALSPAFSSAVTDYAVDVPAGTTHVNVMATSFSGAAIKIANTPGNMNCVDIRGGVASIAITLELDGAVAATYTLRPNVTAAQAADARVVMHEKPPVEADDAAPHAHTHNGVACTADHSKDESHGHGHGEKKEHSHGHGHSHDGGKTECTADHSKEEGHGHGHGEKKKEHSHHQQLHQAHRACRCQPVSPPTGLPGARARQKTRASLAPQAPAMTFTSFDCCGLRRARPAHRPPRE